MTASSLTVAVPDGAFQAYVAAPEGSGPWPAVVVIQEIFGVNAVMRGVADDLAAQGFLAVAPDLFWRIQPGVQLTDQSKGEWDQAFALMNAFDADKGVEDIAATIALLRDDPRCTGKVGDVGYCLGGKLAYLTATRTDADASVGYYGVGLETLTPEAEKLASPLMLHVAEKDSFSSPEALSTIERVLGAHPHVTLHVYPGRDHAFARKGGEHYDAADAALANGRTVDFFRKALA